MYVILSVYIKIQWVNCALLGANPLLHSFRTSRFAQCEAQNIFNRRAMILGYNTFWVVSENQRQNGD